MAKKTQWNITYGSDPELMIFNKNIGRVVSSINILKTDKNNPIILDKQDKIKIYADNTLLEAAFNPCNSKGEMIKRFRKVFANTQDYLGSKYSLLPQAAFEYSQDELKPSYGIDPMEIGCNPSFNAWEKTINQPNPFVGGLRTGSCHFHIGNPQLCDFDTRVNLIKLLDINLGSPFVIVDKDETSKIRRQWYGGASEHRPTNYGAEYRVLSPYVLKSPEMVELALDLIEYSVEQIKDGSAIDIINSVNPEMVQNAINKCDTELAQKVLVASKMPADFAKRINKNYSSDFYKNWDIK